MKVWFALCLKIENALDLSRTRPYPKSDQEEDIASAVTRLEELCAHCNGDVSCQHLLRQLAVLRHMSRWTVNKMRDICTCLNLCHPTMHEVFSAVSTLIRLFLVTSNFCNRKTIIFTMRRLKTYLHSTMTPKWLNSVTVLNVNKYMLNEIDDDTTLDESVSCRS